MTELTEFDKYPILICQYENDSSVALDVSRMEALLSMIQARVFVCTFY